MKAISEMTLEELQDHATAQQTKIAALEEEKQTHASEMEELRKTNLMLQNRNNALFRQVEQQNATPPTDPQTDPEPPPVESCEDYAIKNMKGILNR